MVMVMVMVKIDEQGRIIIPKEIRERKKLNDEVVLEETNEGLIIKPKSKITWKQFFKKKLQIDWNKVRKLDLSEENLDDNWL
jgi:AbrB family looped-hinge helix DNA binding protein